MSDTFVMREFLNPDDDSTIYLSIDTEDNWCDIRFSLKGSRGQVFTYVDMFSGSQDVHLKDVVKFFETLRRYSEEAIDEITSRWITIKVKENEREGKERSDKAEAPRIDGEAEAGFVQEESDFDSSTDSNWYEEESS